MSIFRELDIDEDDAIWTDFALCRGIVTKHDNNDPFFDAYEDDQNAILRPSVDDMCLKCPVQLQCYETGISERQYGVWGGIYLDNGNIDRQRNSHKTDEWWGSAAKKGVMN